MTGSRIGGQTSISGTRHSNIDMGDGAKRITLIVATAYRQQGK
jgi:hypothetical protein